MGKVYKLCDCGHINVFEENEIAPRRCAQCQRNILQKEIFSLDEYEKRKSEEESEAENATEEAVDTTKEENRGLFKLVNKEKGIEIILPEHDDFIIGRDYIGSEVFGSTISRKHLYVTPTGRLGIKVTDKESLNGTKINDELLAKGTPRIVVPGNTITLDINNSGITLMLQRIE